MKKETILTTTNRDLRGDEIEALESIPIDFLGNAQHIYKKESLSSLKALADILRELEDEDAMYLLLDWS